MRLLRLKKAGAQFDYYAMDAFWFDPDGAYRTWKKPDWPDGPEPWIRKCEQNGILPGLWFSTNTLVQIKAAPQWRDSLNKQGGAMSMFEGGFLPDFMSTLQYWHDQGVRMFLFDFADLSAATPHAEATMTKRGDRPAQFHRFARCACRFSPQEPGRGLGSVQRLWRCDGFDFLSISI